MSSYLNFYLRCKETKKLRHLFSVSRSHPVYQAFNENLQVPYSSNGPETTKRLWAADVTKVINDLDSDAADCDKRVKYYERYVKDNPEYVEDIIALKDSKKEYLETAEQLSLIEIIATECEENSSDFEFICVNID